MMWWAWFAVGLLFGMFFGMVLLSCLVAASDADDANKAEERQAQAMQRRRRRSAMGDGQMGRPGGDWMVRD